MDQHLLNTNKAKMEILTGPKSRNLKVMGYREEICRASETQERDGGRLDEEKRYRIEIS